MEAHDLRSDRARRRWLEAFNQATRENPRTMALSAAGLGFAVAQLPAGVLGGALVRTIVFLLKPIALVAAVAKLVELSRPGEKAAPAAPAPQPSPASAPPAPKTALPA
jgi:hypothetical protein